MSEFQRVKDKVTGHEYSARRPDLNKVTVLDKPAVDSSGRPLSAKYKVSVATPATAKQTHGGESASKSKEDSK